MAISSETANSFLPLLWPASPDVHTHSSQLINAVWYRVYLPGSFLLSEGERRTRHDPRAGLLQVVLAHLQNLVEIHMDHYHRTGDSTRDVLKGLASHHGLRSLPNHPDLNPPQWLVKELDPKAVSDFLRSNSSNQVSLGLSHGEEDIWGQPSGLSETLASMPHLKLLDLAHCPANESWGDLPFASGGLSELSLAYCDNSGCQAMSKPYSPYTPILSRSSHCILCPVSTAARSGTGPRVAFCPDSKLSVIDNDATEDYIRRFSSSPITSLEVITIPPPPTHTYTQIALRGPAVKS
jgi:hypothetical protein